MKTFAYWMVQLGFNWLGFWLEIVDPKLFLLVKRALDDGFNRYKKP